MSPKTIRFSYGYPLRSVFLPWRAEQEIIQVSEVTNRKLDSLSTGLLEHGNKRAQVTNQTVWTHMKAINRFWPRQRTRASLLDAKSRLPKLDGQRTGRVKPDYVVAGRSPERRAAAEQIQRLARSPPNALDSFGLPRIG